MPLEILAVMVVAGLALVIGAVHFSGMSRPARIGDAEVARARFLVDYPGEQTGEIAVSDDGRAAFIALGGGRTGLVHAIGARYVTRILQPQAVRAVNCDGSGGLALRLRDFTLPAEHAKFASASDAAKVSNWLSGATNA
jgi:hypothetical protein